MRGDGIGLRNLWRWNIIFRILWRPELKHKWLIDFPVLGWSPLLCPWSRSTWSSPRGRGRPRRPSSTMSSTHTTWWGSTQMWRLLSYLQLEYFKTIKAPSSTFTGIWMHDELNVAMNFIVEYWPIIRTITNKVQVSCLSGRIKLYIIPMKKLPGKKKLLYEN